MTQGELGAAVGVSAASICETEADNRKVFSPDLMVAVSDAVHDIRLLQEYCDLCPIRTRIIIRKFRALNNIQGGAHVATIKVNQKLVEATEALSVMLPKMLRKGFETCPEYHEFRNEAILKILDVKRGCEILLDQMLDSGVVSADELRVLVDVQQRLCEAKGHHIPEQVA
jgi:hypothetical protein